MGVWERVVATARRGAGVLGGQGELLLPSVSLARVLPGPGTAAGQAVGFGVLAVAFFVAAPKVYPDRLEAADDTGLRATFVVAAVAFSVAFTWVRTSVVGAALAFATLLGTIVWFDLYLAYRKQWKLFDPEGEAVALVDEIAPHDLADELTTDFDRTGWRRYVAVGAWLGALGTFFAIPAFLAGLLGTLVGTAFPLPDLLLLSVVSFDTATRTEYATDPFDVEGRVYPAVAEARTSLTGAVLVLFVAFGILLSVQVLVTALRLSFDVTADRLWTASPLARWNSIGVAAVLVAVAVYDFRVWLRAIDRLPEVHTGRDDPDVPAGDESRTGAVEVPAYPRGLTVPPTLALVALAPFVPSQSLSPTQTLALAVIWPVLLAGLGLCASLSSSRAVSNVERSIVVVALLVQTTGSVLAANADRPTEAVTDPFLLFSLVAVPLIAYLPDVVRYAIRHDDARRYATGAYLLYLATATAVVSLTTSGPTAVGIRVFALGVFVGGLILLLGEFLFS